LSTPYIGEIRLFGGNFAPVGWMLCQGQTLPISEYDTLFTLIGTTYGGDGQETFNLPDLQGRIPIHNGQGTGQTYQIGEKSGVEAVTLTAQQIPVHNHALVASGHIADQGSPANNVPAQSSVADLYIEDVPNSPMAANAVGPAGGSQPHDNMPPFLGLNFIISLYGIYPSQT
jgi:microcystin-dependent protein